MIFNNTHIHTHNLFLFMETHIMDHIIEDQIIRIIKLCLVFYHFILSLKFHLNHTFFLYWMQISIFNALYESGTRQWRFHNDFFLPVEIFVVCAHIHIHKRAFTLGNQFFIFHNYIFYSSLYNHPDLSALCG